MTRAAGGHSPANVTHFPKGMDFRARRGDLLRHARHNHADQAVLDEIQAVPDQDYASMADVMKGFGTSH